MPSPSEGTAAARAAAPATNPWMHQPLNRRLRCTTMYQTLAAAKPASSAYPENTSAPPMADGRGRAALPAGPARPAPEEHQGRVGEPDDPGDLRERQQRRADRCRRRGRDD